jgi:hypothetical protein
VTAGVNLTILDEHEDSATPGENLPHRWRGEIGTPELSIFQIPEGQRPGRTAARKDGGIETVTPARRRLAADDPAKQ